MKKLLLTAVAVVMLVAACGDGTETTPTVTEPLETPTSDAGSPTPSPTAPMEASPTPSPSPTVGTGGTATPTGPAGGTPTIPASTSVPNVPAFDNATDLNTLNDFINQFEVLEYQWSDGGTATATYRMEYVGTESVNGVDADHVKMTLSNGEQESVTEVWTDSDDNIVKLVVEGEELPTDQIGTFAPLATAAFFAPLATVPDLSEFDETYMTPGGLYTVRSSESGTKDFDGVTAQTWTMEVEMADEGNVIWEISDFGEVSLFTAMRFDQAGGQTGAFAFEVTEVKLR
jgi:hypothetical protein